MSMPSSEMPAGTLIAFQLRPPLVVRRMVDFQPTAQPRFESLNCTLVRFLRTPGANWVQAPVAALRLRNKAPAPTATGVVEAKPTASGLTVSWEYSSVQ